MSACVKWAKEQVDTFNTTWTECMEQAKEHSRMLSEVGLDFRSRVGLGSLDGQGESLAGPVGLGLM